MKSNIGAKIIDVARFLPEHIAIPQMNEEEKNDPLLQNDFFKSPKERRFAFPQYSSADLGTMAMKELLGRTGISPTKIDLILYSCAITDYVNIGIGPDIQHRSGATNATVLQIDTGCVSFLSMLNTADAFIRAGRYKTIAIVTVTNFISRLKDFQRSPKSWVLGDGASATLVVAGTPNILASQEQSFGENYGLMVCQPRGKNNEVQHYWDTGAGPLQVEFSEGMIERLKHNAVSLVSESVKASIAKAGFRTEDISLLITHQPNVGLIKQWRLAIGIDEPRVYDTFQRYGNLFQSSIPVTISDAVDCGKIRANDTIAMGTFSNGGDFVGSMVLRW